MKTLGIFLVAVGLATSAWAQKAPQVKIKDGTLEGISETKGVRTFKGIPFAQPPIGDLRWKEPQPLKKWSGVYKADHFGPSAMQRPVFGDMNFRSKGTNEDCLYLNVWAPENAGKKSLPVLVYFYGGGFVAGDGSEPRYDGESMAQKGIVAVTVNYRLNVFGFLAHPELTKESPQHASGNYGLLDQMAALRWVKENIAAFGGDPSQVTIAGESAGSISVSAQMASPLSKNLFSKAIGESGSLLGTLAPVSLAEAEKKGAAFAASLGAKSLAELRALPAAQVLEATAKAAPGSFPMVIDGYFLPKSAHEIFAAGEQAQVPLLAGWNSEEMNYRAFLGGQQPTVENFKQAVTKRFGASADAILKAYNPTSDAEVEDVATALAGDMFLGFSTWKWIDYQVKTGKKPVYRYYYAQPRPAMRPEMGNATPGLAGGIVKNEGPVTAAPKPANKGAVHSAEIEYAMGNLGSNKVYAWTEEDYKVSKVMQEYFANFIKTGNPNGAGLPNWSPVTSDKEAVLVIDANTKQITDKHLDRYETLEKVSPVK
ncbi:carboxylesterase/lipase family protein [Siphonobacter sp. SORGH_AS_1065]|uniref:carboxylesterase/lipase family protein n=1 Tax=Siphonobacter sp. SORGH_AS_1065 TaxID=3041795 RepID=UPI0027818B68|nr:carboxylesterase family protein [Siphonobacter sp. SORGH_AS_1065]MDQ1089729.1 para-nitrobenzyl esterase [Siphonobacter sp. SORGH_AS_1065]